MQVRYAGWVSIVLLLSSCRALQDTSKYELLPGWYGFKTKTAQHEKVYVHPTADSISIYKAQHHSKKSDSLFPLVHLPPASSYQRPTTYLSQSSFDIDFLTIPFKFRPAQGDFPRQFTTSLNGALYLGFRRDIYRLQYKASPLHMQHLRNRHFGFSGGLFTGIGATAMNPWVTQNRIDIEYDGVAWSKGVAGIIAVDRFSLGLALGWDHLLDRNRKYWIYQGKPWIGLAFGLSLN